MAPSCKHLPPSVTSGDPPFPIPETVPRPRPLASKWVLKPRPLVDQVIPLSVVAAPAEFRIALDFNFEIPASEVAVVSPSSVIVVSSLPIVCDVSSVDVVIPSPLIGWNFSENTWVRMKSEMRYSQEFDCYYMFVGGDGEMRWLFYHVLSGFCSFL